MSQEIIEALTHLESERGIPHQILLKGIEDALAIAYRKTTTNEEFVQARYDEPSGTFRIYKQIIPFDLVDEIIVVPDVDESGIDPRTGELREHRHARLDLEALEAYRDQVGEEDVTPDNFGRIAALTARQVIQQKLRDFDQDQIYAEFAGREGELVVGLIQQGDRRHTLIQLRAGVEALLPRSEQVEGERYRHGNRIRAVIKEVERSERGCSIILSRRSPELVRQLFLQETPEASNGLIEITRVVRDAGVRSKIGVISVAEGIDPVGACVGPRGSRVRNVVTELNGEKVDIIPLDVDPARFLAKSLSPAKVREVEIDDHNKQATIIVPDDEVAKAIGQKGQNVRLTAKLTGWKIDILSQSQFAQLRSFSEADTDEDAFDGRCNATLGNGRRCPNAALPGGPYCGLPRHAVLQYFPTNSVKILTGLTADDINDLLAGERVEEIVASAETANADVYEQERIAQEEMAAEHAEQAEQVDTVYEESYED